MQCETRSVRRITTKYKDEKGNIKSKRRAELKGSTVVYEGEYSETDSDSESAEIKNGKTSSDHSSYYNNSGSGSQNKLDSTIFVTSDDKFSFSLNQNSTPPSNAAQSLFLSSANPFNNIFLNVNGTSSRKPTGKIDFAKLDFSVNQRQKLLDIPNMQLKPVKVTEYNEAIDEHSDDDDDENNESCNRKSICRGVHESDNENIDNISKNSKSLNNSPKFKLSKAELEAKINDHLSLNLSKSTSLNNSSSDFFLPKLRSSQNTQENNTDSIGTVSNSSLREDELRNLISNENKEDEKSDLKVIDSTDEKTGIAIRTSIENKIKTNENVKVLKTDNIVDIKETDDTIVKKITTKTRTTKSIVKTTTTTTTKKGIFA